jgi:parvulin-like peptidyl-prolyl isomerase
MAMMSRMRSLAPWFMLSVGGIFVLFMVLSDSKVTEFLGKQKQNVGSVDGDDISYQEYSNAIDNLRKRQEQSGQSIDESQMDYFRDQVWDYLVSQKLLDKKIKEYGIIVTDEEVRNALLGPNPPAMLKQQFTDSTGNFNRQAYENALRDPRNKKIVIDVEEGIKQQLIQQKLQDYLGASVSVSNDEVKDEWIKQNVKIKTNFIAVNIGNISDNDFKVTDEEIKNYYDSHSDDFKVEAQRKLKYVLFKRQASQNDTLLVKNNLTAIVAKLKKDTTSFKKYVEIYSERPYSKDTVSVSSISVDAREALLKGNIGEIVGPVISFEGCIVYRLVDRVTAKKEQVKASHILIKSSGDDKADLKKADDIYNELIKGANFETVAKQKSQDGSASQGGDLGWFGRGQMVKAFEDAAFNSKIGVIQKPVKSQFGYHIIKVTNKANQDLVVEKIVNKIQTSNATSDKLSSDAQDYLYIAKKDGFESEAKMMKYSISETPPFIEDATGIPGIGSNSSLVKWAFDNKTGEISDVYRLPIGYVVAMVSDVTKPGLRKFDEVKPMVKNLILKNKKIAKAMLIASDIRSKIGDSGDPSIAKSVFVNAKVDTTAEFTTSGNIPGVGRDFAFSDYAVKGDIGKWSKPIKGAASAYLIKVTSRTQIDQMQMNSQMTELRKQLFNTKKNRFFGQWIQNLKKEANIVDDRHLFYR